MNCQEERLKKIYCEQSFEYGGMHFIPHSKLGKIGGLSELLLRSDFELGFYAYDFPEI